ncbi:hypothetical protein ACT7DE_11800 [Bacillus paranthracis]
MFATLATVNLTVSDFSKVNVDGNSIIAFVPSNTIKVPSGNLAPANV